MSKHTENPFSNDFDLSNKQKHDIEKIVNNLCEAANDIGISRHDAKQEAYAKGLTSSHDVNATMGVTSYNSMKDFKSDTRTFISYCYDRFNICNINQIKPSMCADFLKEAVEREYAKNSCKGFESSLANIAIAIDRFAPMTGHSRSDEWERAIAPCREMINNDAVVKDAETRAYANPMAIIEKLPPDMQIVANMQLNHGLRLADATKLTDIADNALNVHNSKGGQDLLNIRLSDSEIRQIKEVSGGTMEIKIKQYDYVQALKTACAEAGQEYNGTHGLRHNFAQSRMSELVESGMGYRQALSTVSEEMGHHRPSITLTYLR